MSTKMPDEKKHEEDAQISDEELKDISGSGKTFGGTTIMTWDNTKQTKWRDSGTDPSTSDEEPPTEFTREN